MKKLLIILSLALAATGAYAKDEKAATPQQSKMAGCNKEAQAKDMKGADRKKFMSGCLKGDAKPAEAATPAVPATPATPAKPADKK